MTLAVLALIFGLALLVWSADRFVDGAAAVAQALGMPTLLIGMVVVGFGTSAPEMVVSALSALQGNPGIALGNAYGSNIANIGLILGTTALVAPIAVQSQVLRKELPILILVTLLAAGMLFDNDLSRGNAWMLLGLFAILMSWSIYSGLMKRGDALEEEVEAELKAHAMSSRAAWGWLIAGLVFLVVSSRIVVWGAVTIARGFGISDLVIGLTIVAIGTSLPELASSLAATRKGEHDLALGNVIGSNLFNTLAVVGIAGAIAPMPVAPEVLHRDVLGMGVLTVVLFFFAFGFRGRQGRINRYEGAVLLSCYIGYNLLLLFTELASRG